MKKATTKKNIRKTNLKEFSRRDLVFIPKLRTVASRENRKYKVKNAGPVGLSIEVLNF